MQKLGPAYADYVKNSLIWLEENKNFRLRTQL